MKADKKKSLTKGLSRSEALNCRPIKNNEIKENRLDSGEVMLTYIVTLRPWISTWIRRFGKTEQQQSEKKIQLDELGTTVWDLMDGNRSVRQIIKKFTQKYQIHVQESEVSVTRFLKMLGKRGLIGFK